MDGIMWEEQERKWDRAEARTRATETRRRRDAALRARCERLRRVVVAHLAYDEDPVLERAWDREDAVKDLYPGDTADDLATDARLDV